MAVTPGSNKKSKNKGGTPQGKGGSTPQSTPGITSKTPQSQKGQNVTPKSQKAQTQTPGSHKSAGAPSLAGEGKKPQFQKGQNITPKSQKDQLQTPGSQKLSDMSPKFSKGKQQTPQSEKGQAGSQKKQKGQTITPQGHSGQKQKMNKMEQLQKSGDKSPKDMQRPQASNVQKIPTPTQPKAGTPTTKLQSSNKKRKMDDEDSSSYDSAEEDFEALIGHPKKMKTAFTSPSPTKASTALSPSKQTTGKELSNKKRQQSTPVLGKQSEEKLAVGKKRSYESDSDDDDDDEDDDDDDDEGDDDEDDDDEVDSDEEDDDDEVDSDDDDDDDDVPAFKKKQPAPAVVAKKMKMEEQIKEKKSELGNTLARLTSPAKDSADALTEADLQRDMERQDALDRRMLFVKNIPKSATEPQIKALHSGIVNVQLRAMKWSHKANQQQQFAHLEFKDEKSAEDAYKLLSGKTICDRVLTVDYFGAKSSHPSGKKSFTADQLDPCKLFVSRYPLDMTSEELQVLFPTAMSVEVLQKQQGQPIGFSFVHFKNADACRKAHDKGEGLKVRGRTIMVVYARRKTEPQSRSKPAEQVKESSLPVAASPAKTTAKPSVNKVAQPTNAAVVKGQQQKSAFAVASQPGVASAKLGVNKGPAAAADDDESDDDDDDDSEYDIEEDDDDDDDDIEDDDDDSVDVEDDDDDDDDDE